jgi:YidC/Oxa1 family membrane protein insertase
MKQNQRIILFIILSVAFFIGWQVLGRRFFPNLFPQPGKQNIAKQDDDEDAKKKQAGKPIAKNKLDGKRYAGPVEAPKPGDSKKKPAVDVKQPPKVAAKKVVAPAKPPQPQLALHPRRNIKLGSLDPETGYFQQVSLVSEGAAVEFIELNDKRYQTLDRRGQLKAVGNTVTDVRTFDTNVKQIDDQLKPFSKSLRTVHWMVDGKLEVKGGITTGVTFSFTSPDGKLKVSKRYWLEKVDIPDRDLREVQDTNSTGYELHFTLTIENLSAAPQKDLYYRVQGPVGVPLEDAANARVHRGVVAGFIQDDGTVKSSSLTAKDVVKAVDADDTKEWKTAVRYIGVDVHYFVAMIVPGGDQLESPTIAVARPELIDRNAANVKFSDVSVELTSKPFTLAARGNKGSSIQHSYTLYAGPKRKELLTAYEATAIIKYGWFGWIAQGMLWLMNLLHTIGLPYGLAIVGLTIIVRLCMFPLSRKQAKSASKMKELQPRIAELKKKYANDKEKLARAQMELFSKHGANPLAGCLPVVLQLPIFIGLYQALSNAVDLRLAPFYVLPWMSWIDNLAAPDALFQLGFVVPFVGWTTFNLLPIITIFLFIIQQKMFMPPPTDDQTAMQQKMMKYMSIFMGFLFYTVPSGLCLYFIASSLWGIGERKLLDKKKGAETAGPADAPGPDKGDSGSPPDAGSDKPKGFFGKLIAMADEAAQAKARANGNAQNGKPGSGGKRGRKGRKPRGSRR